MIVYGAGCTWWAEREKAVLHPEYQFPVCRFCNHVVFASPEEQFLDEVPIQLGDYDINYQEFLSWSYDRCFVDMEEAIVVYKNSIKYSKRIFKI